MVQVSPLTVRAKGVIIGPIQCRRDPQRKLENARFEDPLRADERNPRFLEMKPLDQEVPRQHVSIAKDLIGQPFKGYGSDAGVINTIKPRFQEITLSPGSVHPFKLNSVILSLIRCTSEPDMADTHVARPPNLAAFYNCSISRSGSADRKRLGSLIRPLTDCS